MNGNNCKTTCWLVALAAGWLIGLYLWVGADWGFFGSLVVGVVVSVVASLILPRVFCSEAAAQKSGAVSAGASSASGASAASTSSSPAPAPATDPTPTSEPRATAEPEPTPEPEPEPEQVSEPTPDPAPVAASQSGGVIKASTELPGQNELAARKGTWRYQGETSKATALPASDSEPSPGPGVTPAPQDDAIQPQGLTVARESGADDLKMIKGIGPKLERLLNSMGFFHFDQIAGWGASDVAWVDENLVGFKGRVSRDTWVDQAKTLAAGEETEFARRAKKDGIYD